MSLKSSATRYGMVAVVLHWLTALAVILMLVSGLAMGRNPALAANLLPFHVVFGVLVGALTLFRILWWRAFDRHPEAVAGSTKAQIWLARIVHVGLYAVILVMAASGIGTVALSGAGPAIFAGGPLPDFGALAPMTTHGLVSQVLILLALGHICAALFHQFIKRDGLIGRMMPSR